MPTVKADIIFYGGHIITMVDPAAPGQTEETTSPQAVAISDGSILDVGSKESVFRHAGDTTQKIFLDQQTLMPGLIEPHQHAIECALMRGQYVNISAGTYSCFEAIREVMKTRLSEIAANRSSKEWGIFIGWDPELISDLPVLSATYLDDHFTSNIPIVVVGQNVHVAWVNHLVLKASNITKDTENSKAGTIVKDAEGVPTGQLFEVALIFSVIDRAPQPNGQKIGQFFSKQWRAYASAGFTTVTEMKYSPRRPLDDALKQSADRKDFPLRLALYRLIDTARDREEHITDNDRPSSDRVGTSRSSVEFEEGIGNYSHRLWEAGVKIIADGSPHCGTAAIREPYLDTKLTKLLGFPSTSHNKGILNIQDTNALIDTVRRYHVEEKQVAIHSHGERAIDQVLHAYEQVLAQFPNQDNRHRMEHLGLMTVDQIARAGKLNLALSFFVDHLRFYALTFKMDIFGDRVKRWTPLSEATKQGVTWTIHQDHPAFPGEVSPFANMKTAMTRCTRNDPNVPYGPEYRVSVHEALKAYTINAAWQLQLDKQVGSIKAGKKADLVVLSKNPYEVDPFDFESIRVVETFVDGRRTNLAQVKTIPGADHIVLDRAVEA